MTRTLPPLRPPPVPDDDLADTSGEARNQAFAQETHARWVALTVFAVMLAVTFLVR